MTDPALRSRMIFIWSFFFVLCALALLFIFFYVSYLCGQLLLMVGSSGTATCMVPIGTFWFAGGFLLAALISLYRVRTLMSGG